MPQEGPYTAMGWRIEPGSLTELLLRVHRDYPGIPLMITENGAAFDDVVAADGAVHDDDRIDYLRRAHRRGARRDRAGVDVRGYFLWSLMDNFEWALRLLEALRHRARRLPDRRAHVKDSARWYRDVIARNGLA